MVVVDDASQHIPASHRSFLTVTVVVLQQPELVQLRACQNREGRQRLGSQSEGGGYKADLAENVSLCCSPHLTLP